MVWELWEKDDDDDDDETWIYIAHRHKISNALMDGLGEASLDVLYFPDPS